MAKTKIDIKPLRNKAAVGELEPLDSIAPQQPPVNLPADNTDDDFVTELTELSENEQQHRFELEQTIDRGFEQFMEIGLALGFIRKTKLYRSTHYSWKSYCADRFGLERRRSYQLMDAAELVNSLAIDIHHEEVADLHDSQQVGDQRLPLPKKEAHASALASVDEAHRGEVWKQVITQSEQTGKPITGKLINQVAQQVTGVPRNSKAPKDRKLKQAADHAEEFVTNQTEFTIQSMQSRADSSLNKDHQASLASGKQRIRDLTNAFEADEVNVIIKGTALIRLGLAEDWQIVRGQQAVIDESYQDVLTLEEALDIFSSQ